MDQVETGVWQGRIIHRARKPGQCDYWLGVAGRCPTIIGAGDDYFDGEISPYKAGGFALDRYCMAHAEE